MWIPVGALDSRALGELDVDATSTRACCTASNLRVRSPAVCVGLGYIYRAVEHPLLRRRHLCSSQRRPLSDSPVAYAGKAAQKPKRFEIPSIRWLGGTRLVCVVQDHRRRHGGRSVRLVFGASGTPGRRS